MSDLDRFTEFLLREAAEYNSPPATPARDIWSRVASALAEPADVETVDEVASYHRPPDAPREEMWARIEAAWKLRRSAPYAAREIGLEELSGVALEPEPRRDRRSVAMWITGLAVAASLVLGVALGRGPLLFPAGEPQVATSTPSEPVAIPTLGARPRSVSEPLESSRFFVEPIVGSRPIAGVSLRADAAGPGGASGAPVASRSQADRRRVAAQYATSEHLGRAATLLTAFRADASAPAGQGELAGWARELLGETRLLLDLDVRRSPQEIGLLQDLELVLAQIARLGPGAPDFERDVIQEGIERQGTLTRLRSLAPLAGT